MFDRNRFSLVCLIGLVAAGLTALPAVAQEETDLVTDQMIEQAMERSFEGEVTVTGSLIPRADLTALSPVTVMEVPAELTYSGIVRIEDLITQMPQAFAGQNSTIANGATGTATVSLRNLGSNRTLVLINGRRMPPGGVAGGGYAPDLNAVPSALVKRVDVLTGGASTVYGSDAMAGVVNFVLDTDFEGVRGGVQYGGYYHDNNNNFAQSINADRDFDYPTGYDFDGEMLSGNIAVGGKFADGKGHASAYVGYRKLEELTKSGRDYLNCAVWATDDGPICGGSSTTPWGTFQLYNADGTYGGAYMVEGDQFVPRPGTAVFNYAPFNHIQRPDEQYNAGGFANYEVNEHFDFYIEVMYMNNYTDAQIAPSGNFYRVNQINCDNPMLSQQQYDLVCAGAGYADDEYSEVYIGRRNIEGGARYNALGHTNSRIVAGVRGDISDNWSYDFYYLHGQTDETDSYINDLNNERMANALDVIEDPDTGEWVCRSGGADGCVPWNIFQEGGVTQEAADYITYVGVLYGKTAIDVFNLTFTSDWENYGIALPGASEGVQAAFGLSYREEEFFNRPDQAYADGLLSGQGGATEQIEGSYNVSEAFVELLIPIVQDARGAQDLSLELGYRYSDYSTSGGVSTYKGQLSYAPTESWRFRGGYNRAIRAANIRELFRPQGYNLGGSSDICAGPNPSATEAQCANTGVLPGQYGNILSNPANQYNTLEGGNPFLEPEVADTITAGIVWTPQNIRGLSVTLDYYDIDITDTIGSLGADDIIQVCANTGDPALCDLIHRDSIGTLWVTQDGFTETSNQNIGDLYAEGVDLNVNYLLGLGDSGYLAFDLMGTYVIKDTYSDPLIEYDCVGYFGYQCGLGSAEWQHRLRTTWETAFRLNLSLAWRYIDGMTNDDGSPDPALSNPANQEFWAINGIDKIDAYNYFDLAASYTLRNGVKFTIGVNNLFDEEPPLAPDHADDLNIYRVWDGYGRYIFGSIQFNF
ncbi:MAG: TonB-dependent receptor [Thermoanaerobaculales bacterium]|jgi:outer membrane receptor protein involved in Fe transport|nr:TonB-dependent receptor [Thermoanaerobaculales bacterium]